MKRHTTLRTVRPGAPTASGDPRYWLYTDAGIYVTAVHDSMLSTLSASGQRADLPVILTVTGGTQAVTDYQKKKDS